MTVTPEQLAAAERRVIHHHGCTSKMELTVGRLGDPVGKCPRCGCWWVFGPRRTPPAPRIGARGPQDAAPEPEPTPAPDDAPAAALGVAADLAWIEERDGRWFAGPARPADAEGGRP